MRAALVVGAVLALASGGPSGAAGRPGTAPETPWACPPSHPIKGYLSAESGRHVYYVPGARFYEEASPERCYATEDEARRDGSRSALELTAPRWQPAAPLL